MSVPSPGDSHENNSETGDRYIPSEPLEDLELDKPSRNDTK